MQKRINLAYPQQSEVSFEIITFPDGEPHFKFIEDMDHKNTYSIVTRICSPTDLFILMQVGRILNRHGVKYTLYIAYLMGMRVDRVISFSEDFTLELVASAINSLKAFEVFVCEPHSFRTLELINNSRPVPTGTIQALQYITKEDVICFPDSGAYDRYQEYFDDCQYIVFKKERDLNTGRIISLEEEESYIIPNSKVKSIFVLDDLCDGGGTFVLTANKLKELYPEAKLSISVCHMVNPKGIKALSDNYDQVYFTTTYKDWKTERTNVKIVPFI